MHNVARFAAWLLSLACLSQAPVAPVATVAVGDGTVDGSFIQPFKNRWKLVGKAPDGSIKELGTWSDDVTIVSVDGHPALRRRQIWNYGTGTENYFNLVDQKTLAPLISQYTNTPGLYWRCEFAPEEVKYQRSAQDLRDPMQQGTVHPTQAGFDFNGGMFGLLIAGFPLADGYAARFPVFPVFEPNAEPVWIDFHVDGKERVPAGPGKEVDAWKVVVNSPATNEVMRFALTKDPPYVIRLQQEWEGRDWTFEMM